MANKMGEAVVKMIHDHNSRVAIARGKILNAMTFVEAALDILIGNLAAPSAKEPLLLPVFVLPYVSLDDKITIAKTLLEAWAGKTPEDARLFKELDAARLFRNVVAHQGTAWPSMPIADDAIIFHTWKRVSGWSKDVRRNRWRTAPRRWAT
jgi:hypothetical protein